MLGAAALPEVVTYLSETQWWYLGQGAVLFAAGIMVGVVIIMVIWDYTRMRERAEWQTKIDRLRARVASLESSRKINRRKDIAGGHRSSRTKPTGDT